MVQAGADRVFVGCEVWRPVAFDVRAECGQVFPEHFVEPWRVERDVADLLPQLGLVLPADDPDDAVEGSALSIASTWRAEKTERLRLCSTSNGRS